MWSVVPVVLQQLQEWQSDLQLLYGITKMLIKRMIAVLLCGSQPLLLEDRVSLASHSKQPTLCLFEGTDCYIQIHVRTLHELAHVWSDRGHHSTPMNKHRNSMIPPPQPKTGPPSLCWSHWCGLWLQSNISHCTSLIPVDSTLPPSFCLHPVFSVRPIFVWRLKIMCKALVKS